MDDEATFQEQWFDRDKELAHLLRTGKRRRAQLELTQYLTGSEAQIIDAIQRLTPHHREPRHVLSALGARVRRQVRPSSRVEHEPHQLII